MSQWPPEQPRRPLPPPAVPPQFQRGTPQQQPQFRPAPQGPRYGQPQAGWQPQPPPAPQWQPQPYVQVNVQQNAYGPGHAYTRRGLGPFWTIFHLFMTCATCGLWIPIWVWHSRSRNSVTTFR